MRRGSRASRVLHARKPKHATRAVGLLAARDIALSFTHRFRHGLEPCADFLVAVQVRGVADKPSIAVRPGTGRDADTPAPSDTVPPCQKLLQTLRRLCACLSSSRHVFSRGSLVGRAQPLASACQTLTARPSCLLPRARGAAARRAGSGCLLLRSTSRLARTFGLG